MSTQYWKTAIFIDLDYTIMRSVFDTVISPVVEVEMAQKSGKTIAELDQLLTREFSRRHDNPALPVTVKMDWDDIFSTVASRLGIRLNSSPSQAVQSHIGAPKISLYDGVRKTIHELARPERAIVLATDGLRKFQFPILQKFNLISCFNEILTSDTTNTLKKQIEFYGEWPSKSDLQIMVGDRYIDDIAPAKKHGFKTVWTFEILRVISPFERPEMHHWLTEGQQGQPDAIIFSLKELPGVVSDLERKH